MSRRRRYNGEDLFDVADLAEAQGHPDCQPPPDHALYQPSDPSRAAIPGRPWCAVSLVEGHARHRIAADREPLVGTDGDERRWLFCSARCLATWRWWVMGAVS